MLKPFDEIFRSDFGFARQYSRIIDEVITRVLGEIPRAGRAYPVGQAVTAEAHLEFFPERIRNHLRAGRNHGYAAIFRHLHFIDALPEFGNLGKLLGAEIVIVHSRDARFHRECFERAFAVHELQEYFREIRVLRFGVYDDIHAAAEIAERALIGFLTRDFRKREEPEIAFAVSPQYIQTHVGIGYRMIKIDD